MGNWLSAEEISARYAVGEARLLAYAERGNLPMRRVAGAAVLFDEGAVARFFRPRSGMIVVTKEPGKASLGVLGVTRLGDRASATIATTRRRGVRVDETIERGEAARRAAG